MNDLLKRLNAEHSRAAMDYRKATGYEGNTENISTIYGEAVEALKVLKTQLDEQEKLNVSLADAALGYLYVVRSSEPAGKALEVKLLEQVLACRRLTRQPPLDVPAVPAPAPPKPEWSNTKQAFVEPSRCHKCGQTYTDFRMCCSTAMGGS